MATLKFKLVERKTTLGKNAGKKLITAQPIIHGKVSFSDFCKELADGSTVDAADVKAVLSRLATVITRNLERGMSVDCGDLGTFRPAFGSKGVLSMDEFKTELISRPRVVFTPRVAFKNALHGVGFERVKDKDEDKPKADEGGGSPVGGEDGRPRTGI